MLLRTVLPTNSEVYLAGCKGYCQGCHSPHTHDPNLGTPIDQVMHHLIEDIRHYYDRGFVDNIVILGGEPLDNPDNELEEFIQRLKMFFPKSKIWLYTHFEIDEVIKSHPISLGLLDYIKCGKYEESLKSDSGFKDPNTGVTLATSNQYILNVKEYFTHESSDCEG